MHLQSAFSTTRVFHIASVLTRSPFHCQWRETIGSYSWSSLVLACSPLPGGSWLDRIVGCYLTVWVRRKRAGEPRVPGRLLERQRPVASPWALPLQFPLAVGSNWVSGWGMGDLSVIFQLPSWTFTSPNVGSEYTVNPLHINPAVGKPRVMGQIQPAICFCK